jgi:large subunit ribosomal protein L15
MATPSSTAMRPLLKTLQSTPRAPILCSCSRIQLSRCRTPQQQSRSTSSSSPYSSEMEVTRPPPRWSYTPPATKAPVGMNIRDPSGRYSVNKDPRKLNEMYIRMLGVGGEEWLSDETKWLAVTHKSFDHGRRGFNERLSFLGTQFRFLRGGRLGSEV